MIYTAIDFETAASSSASACSVGLVRMDGEGEVLDTYYSLIQPKSKEFSPVCFSIHHLDPVDILSAPTIAEIWPDMKDFIGSSPLVAHNAPFDMKVLRESLASWGVECCHNEYFCTLSLSRRLWKEKRSYSLGNLTAEFGWEYDAHNALSDAEMCGRLFSKLCGMNIYEDDTAAAFFKRVYRDRSYPKKL